jgi:hypothetical protein
MIKLLNVLRKFSANLPEYFFSHNNRRRPATQHGAHHAAQPDAQACAGPSQGLPAVHPESNTNYAAAQPQSSTSKHSQFAGRKNLRGQLYVTFVNNNLN